MRASRSANAITMGVLPVPPTRMLPTIMMGTACGLRLPKFNSFSRSKAWFTQPYTLDKGQSTRLVGPRLSQNRGALLKKEDFFLDDIKGD
jgi:hypothetical protein